MSGFPSFTENIFQRTPFGGCFQYSICSMESNTSEFKLCYMFKHSINEKGMVYGPNGKDIMTPSECSFMVYTPNGKGTVLLKIVFRSGNRHGKRQKNAV